MAMTAPQRSSARRLRTNQRNNASKGNGTAASSTSSSSSSSSINPATIWKYGKIVMFATMGITLLHSMSTNSSSSSKPSALNIPHNTRAVEETNKIRPSTVVSTQEPTTSTATNNDTTTSDTSRNSTIVVPAVDNSTAVANTAESTTTATDTKMEGSDSISNVIATTSSNHNGKTAVIHVGPQKTGSTTIQAILGQLREEEILSQEGYQYGNFIIRTDMEEWIDNARRFSDCFVSDTSVYKHDPNNYCNQTIVDMVGNVTENLVLSSEWLSGDTIQVYRLYDFFQSHWEHLYVVMYYRRFFDWLISYHYQGEKLRAVERRRPILKIARYALQKDSYFDKQYVVDLYGRYKEFFPNVKVIDMDDNNGDVREAFFCGNTIPHSTNICPSFHNIIQRQQNDIGSGLNIGRPLVYEEIAYYAKQLKLIDYIDDNDTTNQVLDMNSNSKLPTLSKLAKMIQQHQEKTLGKTLLDFPSRAIACLTDDEYNGIYQKSKDYQQRLFPEKDSEALASLYEKAKPRFCHVDARIVLTDELEKWQSFFTTIQQSSSLQS